MALQGNLRDFSVSEILQLLGTQKKTGCLLLQRDAETCIVYVNDGRVVSARDPGMRPDDPLVRFLREIHRLSEEQYRGLLTIHRETGRDLEDLLLTGRYMDQEELASYIERQILATLLCLSHWESGSYRFDPAVTWKGARLVRLSTEGALIESARRVDEHKRHRALFTDAHQLLGVRDLPDPDDPLSEEERELFGIIDGQHTVTEVAAAAPLTEYETHEALQRMMEAQWVEFVGRRDPGRVAAAPPARGAVPRGRALAREFLAVAAALIVMASLLVGGRFMTRSSAIPTASGDVFVATQMRDLRKMLELYRREHGVYPERLGQLVEDDWLAARNLTISNHRLRYRRSPSGTDYQLQLDRAR
ncbi:MAG: DUF4388 domain-containing protein [Candidatus Eisenbacteria bacterium]